MQLETNTIRRAFGAIIFSGALVLASGCHSSSVSASGPDPAQANMAPVNGQGQVLAQNANVFIASTGDVYYHNVRLRHCGGPLYALCNSV